MHSRWVIDYNRFIQVLLLPLNFVFEFLKALIKPNIAWMKEKDLLDCTYSHASFQNKSRNPGHGLN
jgi:hypothetical protein